MTKSSFFPEETKGIDYFKAEKDALIKAVGIDLQWNDPKLLPYTLISSKFLSAEEASSLAKKIQNEYKIPEKYITSKPSSDKTVGNRVFISLDKLGESLGLIPEKQYLEYLKHQLPSELHRNAVYRYSSDKMNIYAIAGPSLDTLRNSGIKHFANDSVIDGKFIHPGENITGCYAVEISIDVLKKLLPNAPKNT